MSTNIGAGTIQIPVALQAGSVPAAIDKVIGGFTRLVKKIGKVNAALGLLAGTFIFFASKSLKKSTEEAIRFQTEMAELTKLLGPEVARPLAETIGDLSKVMPIARAELNEVAATAARLGIRGVGNIREFTRVMAMMGVATDIAATEAADALARVALQTKTPIGDMEKVGSVINELSNTMATSSSEIVEAVRRSAPELARFGLHIDEIIAINAALNTVSESASRSGTRLRRFAQSLTDPGKLRIFTDALEMTRNEFEELRKTDALGLITMIIDKYAEGGIAAEKLASGLDARARLALAALTQILASLEGTFGTAKEQMEEAISLMREYEYFAGLVVSKHQILQNRIAETRREIGENMLPVVDAWQTAMLAIAKTINAIVDRPLEGLISDAELQKLERASRAYVSMAKAKGEFRDVGVSGMEDREISKLEAFWLKYTGRGDRLRADPEDAAAALLTSRQMTEMLDERSLEVGKFSQSFIALSQGILESARISKVPLGELESYIDTLVLSFAELDAATAHPAMVRSVSLLDNMFKGLGQTLAGSGNTIRETGLAISTGFANATIAVDAALAGLADRGQSTIQMSLEAQTVIDDLETALFSLNKHGAVAKALLSPAYIEASETVEDLGESTRELTGAQEQELLIAQRTVDEVDRLVKAIRDVIAAREAEAKELRELNRLETEQKKKFDEMAQSGASVAEVVRRLTQEMAGFTEESEVAREQRELHEWMHNLTGLTDEARESLSNLIQAYGEWRSMEIAREEAQDIEDSLSRMNKLDFTTLQGKMRLFERIITGLADSTIDFFDALVTGSENAAQAFADMIKSITEELLRAQLMQLFMDVLGPGGIDIFKFGQTGKSTVTRPSNRLFNDGPFFDDVKPKLALAKGGTLPSNTVALVGEEGPELFVPDEDADPRFANVQSRSLGTVGKSEDKEYEVSKDGGDQKTRVVRGAGKVVGKDGIIVGESGPEFIVSETPGKVITAEQTPAVARAKDAKEADVTVDVGDNTVKVETPDVDTDPQGLSLNLDSETPDIKIDVAPSAGADVAVPDIDMPEVTTTMAVPEFDGPGDVDVEVPQVSVSEPDYDMPDIGAPEISMPTVRPVAIGKDVDLPVPTTARDIGDSMPDMPDTNVQVPEIGVPAAPDVEYDAPDVNVQRQEMVAPDVQMGDVPQIDIPDSEIIRPEMVEVPDIQTSVNPDVDVIAPTITPVFRQTFGDNGKLVQKAATGDREVKVDVVADRKKRQERVKEISGSIVDRDFFPPMMAKGGKIDSEQMAIVGERGPELFVPDVGGTIVPNNKVNTVGNAQEMNVNVNNNFTIQAMDAADVKRVLAREKEFITGLTLTSIDRSRALKGRR